MDAPLAGWRPGTALVLMLMTFARATGHSDPATAPPFSYSLDQSVPCPLGSEDFSLGRTDGGAPIQPTPELQAALGEIPAALDHKIKELHAPSASVLIVQGGKTMFTSFRGTAKLNRTVELKDTTGYQIASISKTSTTALLFKLRDQGKLPQGLDTPVSTLLPGFRIKSRYASKRPITLRALAMHASGLPREAPECSGCTQDQILDRVASLYTLCEQFGGTHYSNLVSCGWW